MQTVEQYSVNVHQAAFRVRKGLIYGTVFHKTYQISSATQRQQSQNHL